MLEEGRIFKLEAPTHIVQVGQKSHYFFSKDEFEARKVQGSVTLLKGLGEFTADQMKESMFGSAKRLTKYEWNEEVAQILTDLMATDVEPRRMFLFNEIDFSKVVE